MKPAPTQTPTGPPRTLSRPRCQPDLPPARGPAAQRLIFKPAPYRLAT
jgi:hypothetical protein